MKKQLSKFILCLTTVILVISCGSNNDSPTNPDQGEFTVHISTIDMTREEKIIGTSSENTSLIKEGKIKCYPGTEAKVEISKVTAVSGGMSLEPTDFELTTSTVSATANEIRIKLSASGIEKVRKATAGEVSEYTFTFLFTRTSDNKTATSETKLYVANIAIIKQSDIETAMREVENGNAGKGNLVVNEYLQCVFNLSGFTLNKTSGYTATASITHGSIYVHIAESAILSQTYKGGKYGFQFRAKGVKNSDTEATFTITATVNDGYGYMLDDAISYVATDGFKLVLNLQGGGTWKQL